MIISPDLSESIKQHALQEFPKESCGIVLYGGFDDSSLFGTYIPLENTHISPTEGFKIPNEILLSYSDIVAIVHSHPNGPNCPSEMDMVQQDNSQIPWIIVSTDGVNCYEPFAFGEMLPIPDLLNRPFMSGVTDCYDAIRHRLLEKGIKLKNFPREWGWWRTHNLYEDNLAGQGFRILAEGEALQPYDCFLLKLRSTVYNHGGVYLGEGLVYHHLGSDRDGHYSPSRLPVVEYGHRWLSLNPTLVRHESLDRSYKETKI